MSIFGSPDVPAPPPPPPVTPKPDRPSADVIAMRRRLQMQQWSRSRFVINSGLNAPGNGNGLNTQ